MIRERAAFENLDCQAPCHRGTSTRPARCGRIQSTRGRSLRPLCARQSLTEKGEAFSLLANKLNQETVEQASAAIDVFKALADGTRRDIIKLLRDGPLTSGEIAARFPTAWATVSRHLGVLRAAELITATRNGGNVVYELNTTVLQELLTQIYDWTKRRDDDA
jgi:DNA-binding transcriptional ArsR family regulator